MDGCVWYKDDAILFYYVDDGIFVGPDSKANDRSIKDIEKSWLDIKDKGNIEDYLGINFK